MPADDRSKSRSLAARLARHRGAPVAPARVHAVRHGVQHGFPSKAGRRVCAAPGTVEPSAPASRRRSRARASPCPAASSAPPSGDVFVEYAKESPEDILVRITVHNRGPEASRLRVLPTPWFHNTWSWGEDDRKPVLREVRPGTIHASHQELGEYWMHCDGAPELLFIENESNVSVGSAQCFSLRLGRVPPVHHLGTQRSGKSCEDGDQGRKPTMSWKCPPAATRPSGCVSQPPRQQMPSAVSRR
jgi:hypothetical protein